MTSRRRSLSWTNIDYEKKTVEDDMGQNTCERIYRDMWKTVLDTDESKVCLDRPDGRIRVW